MIPVVMPTARRAFRFKSLRLLVVSKETMMVPTLVASDT